MFYASDIKKKVIKNYGLNCSTHVLTSEENLATLHFCKDCHLWFPLVSTGNFVTHTGCFSTQSLMNSYRTEICCSTGYFHSYIYFYVISFSELIHCFTISLDGHYDTLHPGEWEAWSPCSTPCGPNGSQNRSRSCLTHPVMFNYSADGFILAQSRACNTEVMPCGEGKLANGNLKVMPQSLSLNDLN